MRRKPYETLLVSLVLLLSLSTAPSFLFTASFLDSDDSKCGMACCRHDAADAATSRKPMRVADRS
jgi:hypothetical protein